MSDLFYSPFKRTEVTVTFRRIYCLVCTIISLWRYQILLSLLCQNRNRWASWTVRSDFWLVPIPLSIDWSSVCSNKPAPGLLLFPGYCTNISVTLGSLNNCLKSSSVPRFLYCLYPALTVLYLDSKSDTWTVKPLSAIFWISSTWPCSHPVWLH